MENKPLLKYRVLLVKDYRDYPNILQPLKWMLNDLEYDETKEEWPNAKAFLYEQDGDILFGYSNLIENPSAIDEQKEEFADFYIQYANSECAVGNVERHLITNTTSKSKETDLFQRLEGPLSCYYKDMWKFIGKSVEEINQLSNIYTSSSAQKPVEEPKEFDNQIVNEVAKNNEGTESIETGIETTLPGTSEPKEEDVVSTPDPLNGPEPEVDLKELVAALNNEVSSLKSKIDSLEQRLSKLEPQTEEAKVEEKPEETPTQEPQEVTEPKEEPKVNDFIIKKDTVITNEPVIKEEPTEIPVDLGPTEIPNIDKEESTPVVSEPTKDPENIPTEGNQGVTSTYQNAVFYPKNPVKRESEAQMSQTNTEILEPNVNIKDISTSNESVEEKTVIYNTVSTEESLWNSLYKTVATEDELSALIVENYENLPKSVQADYLRYNMYDKYVNERITTISKVEAIKRKVKVKQL